MNEKVVAKFNLGRERGRGRERRQLTAMINSDMFLKSSLLSGSVRTVRTAVRSLTCVSSQVYHHWRCIIHFPAVFTDQTLVSDTAIFSPAAYVRVEAFHRAERQPTVRTVCCRVSIWAARIQREDFYSTSRSRSVCCLSPASISHSLDGRVLLSAQSGFYADV